jgi:hypothetical protein
VASLEEIDLRRDDLVVQVTSNWAYMTIAALAWTLKAWCALLLPITPRWAERHSEQRRRLLTMDFRTLPRRVHRDPLPDHHHRPTRTLAHPHLQPMAPSAVPPDRPPLTTTATRVATAEVQIDHRPDRPARQRPRTTIRSRSCDTHPHRARPRSPSRSLLNAPTTALKPHRVDPSPRQPHTARSLVLGLIAFSGFPDLL